MSKIPNKKLLSNGVKEAGTEVKLSRPAGVPRVSRGQESQKRITRWLYYVICKQRKDQILGIERECISTGRTIGCWSYKNQVRSIFKTGKLSKVEIEHLKKQIKQLHVDSGKCETGERERAEEEVLTQADDNVLLQEFTARTSGYVEDTIV